jgi:hypothetical protein
LRALALAHKTEFGAARVIAEIADGSSSRHLFEEGTLVPLRKTGADSMLVIIQDLHDIGDGNRLELYSREVGEHVNEALARKLVER